MISQSLALLLLLVLIHATIAGGLQTFTRSRKSSTLVHSLGSDIDAAAAGAAAPPPSPAAADAAHAPARNRQACRVPSIYRSAAEGVTRPALPDGEKPNFIIILTDDQGWDDIGLHNPFYVNTPNLDRFIKRGMLFDNFYTSSQCSHSRAALLTGRHAAKVGTMLVHGGWDYINSAEATAGEVMSQLGYHTAQYGKWHNGRTLGYEPWNVGFQDSWFPSGEAQNSLINHNGTYVQSSKWIDEALIVKVLDYLGQRQQDKQPFFAYYAPHAIHTSRADGPFKGPAYRAFPKEWRARYDNVTKYDGVAGATKDAWAMLEWLDSILGRLFDYLDSSPLGNNTYVMIMGDNGPMLLQGEETGQAKQRRMPSNMEGMKSLPFEGGIRNFLAVQGPGIPAGAVDSTLLGMADLLPTMVDLAGNTSVGWNTSLAGSSRLQDAHRMTAETDLAGDATDLAGNTSLPANSTDPTGNATNDGNSTSPSDNAAAGHLPWDGISFKNLLLSGKPKPTPARRGMRFATKQQADRFLFTLVPHCWDPDAVPHLTETREVNRSQLLLDYDQGGMQHSVYGTEIPGMTQNPGFQLCIAVRYKQYKWLGFEPGKVYIVYPSHIERSCTEVPPASAAPLAAGMQAAARAWWRSVVASPFSFTKPVFYLGLRKFTATNILADGAHERTPGAVKLTVNGAAGFYSPGDRMCFGLKVNRAGRYSVTLFYTSKMTATFRWSVGPYADIIAGTAPSVTTELPVMTSTISGQTVGVLSLLSSKRAKWDGCLELISREGPADTGVFTSLYNIRMVFLAQKHNNTLDSTTARPDQQTIDNDLGAAAEPQTLDNTAVVEHQAVGVIGGGVAAAVAAPDIDVQGQYKWLEAALQQDQYNYDSVESLLRHKYRWPRGQSRLESMFSPYDAEDIAWCSDCKPGV